MGLNGTKEVAATVLPATSVLETCLL